MTARWRIPIYAAFLGLLAGFAALQQPNSTKTEQGPRRESLRQIAAVVREESSTSRLEPIAPEPVVSPPSAPKPPSHVSAPDSPQEFVDATALSDDQATRVNALTAEWRRDLERLAGDATARGLAAPEVSDRAATIQFDFEGKLRALLSPAQMDVYETLHRQGRMGTYVIELPRASSP